MTRAERRASNKKEKKDKELSQRRKVREDQYFAPEKGFLKIGSIYKVVSCVFILVVINWNVFTGEECFWDGYRIIFNLIIGYMALLYSVSAFRKKPSKQWWMLW